MTLSKEDLMTVWRSQYVMEHSVTRVISTLRKKLGDTHRRSSFIKTIPRAGYQYIGKVKIVKELPNQKKSVIPLTSKPFSWLTHPAVWLQTLLIIVILSYSAFNSPQINPQPSRNGIHEPIREIIDTNTLKTDPSTSPSGEWISYTATTAEAEEHIKFVNTQSGATWQFKKSGFKLSSPNWLTVNNLVYRQWNERNCHVRKISFDDHYVIKSDEIITHCSTKNVSNGLAVLNEREILITDSDNLSSPLTLKKVVIETGAKETINIANVYGHGIYRVYTSPNKQYIAILKSPNWFSTIIRIFPIDNLHQPIWETHVDYPLFSVALDNHRVTYKNAQGSISTANFLAKSSEQQFVPLLITQAIYSPVYSPNGFLFTEGEMFANKVSLLNLTSDLSRELVELKNSSISNPTFIDENTIVYASNQTGINQLWLFQINEKKRTQISNFKQRYFIYRIAFNDAKNLIAISTNKGIIVARYDHGRIGEVITELEGKFPAFWENKLIFNKFTNDRNAIYSYAFDTKNTDLLVNNGAYKTIIDSNKLYYSKFHKLGIWQYNESGPDNLIYMNNSPVVPEAWDVYQGNLYIGDQENNTIFQINIMSKQTTPLMMKQCKTINIIADNVCLAIEMRPSTNRLLKFTYGL